MWWKKVLGYLIGAVSGGIAVLVQAKTGNALAGAAAGGTFATAACRLLHLQPPPGTPPPAL